MWSGGNVSEGGNFTYTKAKFREGKSMLHSEEEFEQWLHENCSKVERGVAFSCLRLFNGETVKVEATLKREENHKRERG